MMWSPTWRGYSPVTTCWRTRGKLLNLRRLLKISPVCFRAQRLLALETARRVVSRSCLQRRDSGLLSSCNYDELILGPKPKKPYWPQMNADEHG